MKKKPLHLLILEDSSDDAELAVRELERNGFIVEWSRVETAKTFREALEKKPDLILSDYVIPSFSGIDALKIQQEIAPEIPLIVVSGKIGEEVAVECMKCGAKDYVLKNRLLRLGPVVKRVLEEAEVYRVRKEMEKELRKNQASLAEAQRIAHLGNWDWDIMNNKIWWSDEIYRIFGLDPQEFTSTYKAFLNSVHPDDREFVKESINKALYDNKHYSIDHRIVLPDGSERIVHEQAEVFFDETDRPIRMAGTLEDITERKKVEEKLRESEEKLRNIFSSSPGGITATNLKGTIIECNQAILDMHGFSSKEELLGKGALDLIAPKDHQRALDNMNKTLKEGFIKDVEYTFLTEDGAEFLAKLSVGLIQDSAV